MNKKRIQKKLLKLQRQERLAHHMYQKLANVSKDQHNKEVLQEIADSEQSHAESLVNFMGEVSNPNPLAVRFFVFLVTILVKVLGLTFVLKLFERNEERFTQRNYEFLSQHEPELLEFIIDEESHEQKLLALINENRLEYVGSIVLGLNDALVELTGALAGFTLSIQNSRTIALVGLITGISASFSMAASEYLSTKAEGEATSKAIKSSLYTGVAYVFTVIFLITPFLLIQNYILSLLVTLFIAIAIIAVFNYYISVVKDGNFRRQFSEMAIISLGVALISFGIGYVVNTYIGLEI